MAYDELDNGQERKTYYVSVQAGQVLEDPEAAAYELVIRANEEEAARLRELFGELSSVDEAEVGAFGLLPLQPHDDNRINAAYDGTIDSIYRLLYECGTDETKRHIERMELF